jgi:hypothetical protein
MDESLPTLKASVRDALRARLRGITLLPGDAEYDSARRLWNGAIDVTIPRTPCDDASAGVAGLAGILMAHWGSINPVLACLQGFRTGEVPAEAADSC